MVNDQIFKETLQEMLAEFLRLFYPDVAARLDFSQVTFLDKEVFTDFPEGRQREADVVAQVTTRDGDPEILLIHVEVEAQKRRTFPARMFAYYALFRVRKRLPVFPLVVYLSAGAGGLTEQVYEEALFGKEILRFRYGVIGLRDLCADEYLQSDNPLAFGLSALMKPSMSGRVEQKLVSLRKIAVSGENAARQGLLSHLVETYLPLASDEQAAFEQRLQQEDAKEVREMMTVYEERGFAKGEERGKTQGKRDSLLRVLRRKFGELPGNVIAQIEAVTDTEELDALFDRALDVTDLAEFSAEQASG